MSDTTKVLIEEIYGTPSRVDIENGILHDCLLLGAESRNGTRYPQETRDAALSMFEGAKVNLSHPSKRDKQALIEAVTWDRRYGKAMNCRNTPEGIRGDVKVLKSHNFTKTLMEAAQEMPEMFGFSPVMVGVCSPTDATGVETCVRIKKVKSVDIVTDPGTTKSLWEDADMDKLLTEEEKKEDPKLHEDELHELEDIEQELKTLIEQVTTELVDFHHEHKDHEQASSRIGQHLKHHAKMHLKGKEEAEEKPAEHTEEHKEEDIDWEMTLRGNGKPLIEERKPEKRFEVKKVKSGYQATQTGDNNWANLLRGVK